MLDGLKIVEIEGLGPAPFAGMWLADMGAQVTVVHRAGGAGAGAARPRDPSLLDRGKRSIVLDLKAPDDLRIAQALVDRSDALIEGFRPGVMERLGLGPDLCLARNPKLVYARMTGWGQSGPRACEAGHDLNYVATSGALHYASLPGDAPVTPATLLGDIGGGAMYLLAGLMAGLLRAQRSGQGCVVDAAIVDGSAHMMALLMSIGQAGGLSQTRGHSLLDGPHWSRTYLCACGGYMSVQALEPQFYAEFLARLGLDDDPVFAAQHDRVLWGPAAARLTALFAGRDRAHWGEVFAGSDACAAPVLSPWDAARDPHMTARKVWQDVHGALQPAPAPRFDAAVRAIAAPCARDASRADILAEIEAEL